MKKLITLTLLALSLPCMGQFSFDEYVDRMCLTTGEDLVTFEHYDMYQTVDNSPEGERLEQCIGLDPTQNYKVNLESLDLSKKLFLSSKEGRKQALFPNTLNNFDISISALQSTTCTVTTTIPNPSNGNLAEFTSELNIDDMNQGCMVSQGLEGEELVHLLWAVDLSLLTGEDLWFSYCYIYDSWASDWQYSVGFYDWENTGEKTYTKMVYEPIIVLHDLEEFPSNANYSWVEMVYAGSEPDTSVLDLKVTVDEYGGLFFQKHVGLRGGELGDGSGRRHNLTLEIGSPMCLFLVEAVQQGGSIVMLPGGRIDLIGAGACVQLRDGSELVVAPACKLDYGVAGRGMLAIREHSQVRIERDGHLYFDGMVVLFGDEGVEDIAKIEVEPGGRLTCGADARIDNDRNTAMYLDIYVEAGGQVDLSAMAPTERAKVRIHHVKPEPGTDDLLLWPNPAHAMLNISAGHTGHPYTIFDMMGQAISSGTAEGSLDLTSLTNGVYILRLGEQVGRFVKR